MAWSTVPVDLVVLAAGVESAAHWENSTWIWVDADVDAANAVVAGVDAGADAEGDYASASESCSVIVVVVDKSLRNGRRPMIVVWQRGRVVAFELELRLPLAQPLHP
jgi:hypothetical protein